MAINSPKNDFAEKHRWLTYADEPDTVYDGSKIMDGSVTTDKLADYAVTTDKIDDESITLSKMDTDVLNLLEGNVKGFDTVADMQSATLAAGDVCHTNGFCAAGDGGAAFYTIGNSIDFIGAVNLGSGLYANLVERSKVNAISLGFKRNDGSDNSALMTSIVDRKNNYHVSEQITIVFPAGTYAFSPTKIKSWGLILEGENNSLSSSSRFLSTIFCPVSNQDYIIMLGSDDTNLFNGGYVFNGNGIKNIQFSTNKHGTTARRGTANNYQINKACLMILRQNMACFENLAFYYCYGSALELASLWECYFSTIIVRNVLAPDSGAIVFATDFLSAVTTSDFSGCYFEQLNLESIAGGFIVFENNCNVENNVFNAIVIEDARLDIQGQDASLSWGTTWTQNTWLPDGVDSPDVELGIFNFETGAYFANNTINSINASFLAARSYYFDETLYTHDAIVKCDGFVRKFDFQCGLLTVQFNRTNVKTLINKNIGTPSVFKFIVSNAVMTDDVYGFVLDGVCRLYRFNDMKLFGATSNNAGYTSAADYAIVSGITTTSLTVIPNETTTVYAPLVEGNTNALSTDKIVVKPINREIFSNAGNASPAKIPIMGETLHARIYQETANSIIYLIYDNSNTQQSVGNFSTYSAGWQWVTVDTSSYVGQGYIVLPNRPGDYANNALDVLYWTN